MEVKFEGNASKKALLEEFRNCVTLFETITNELLEMPFNLQFLQLYLQRSLMHIEALHLKDYNPRRKDCLKEIYTTMYGLNTKLRNGYQIPGKKLAFECTTECQSELSVDYNNTENAHYDRITSSDKLLQSRQLAIEQTILCDVNITLLDVIGFVEAKRSLREAIVIPLLFPQLFTGERKPWNRILMYGPPGTGKSRLAQAIAYEIESAFYSVSSADLLSSWFGESEKLVRELFQHARRSTGRCVVFIDEIDSLCRKRSEKEDESVRRIKTELLHQMDGSSSEDTIFLLSATNCPWEIDPAFLRRFQKRVYIPLPNKESRISILQLNIGNDCTISSDEWNQLGDLTEGYSGSDLANLAKSAMYEPVRQLEQAKHWVQQSTGTYRPSSPTSPGCIETTLGKLPPSTVRTGQLKMRDVRKCLLVSKPTICETDIKRFDNFTLKFGQDGK